MRARALGQLGLSLGDRFEMIAPRGQQEPEAGCSTCGGPLLAGIDKETSPSLAAHILHVSVCRACIRERIEKSVGRTLFA